MLGGHLISHWTRLQENVALSSGEAELYSANKGLSRYVGIVNLCREMFSEDFGRGKLGHHIDVTATRSMMLREGLGGIKHLEVRDLWCQGIVKKYDVTVYKIPRERNPADMLASPCNRADMTKFMMLMGLVICGDS